MRMLLDGTNFTGSDADDSDDYDQITVPETDQQIYADEEAPVYEQSANKSEQPQEQKNNRQELIEKAKANAQGKSSVAQKNQRLNPEGQPEENTNRSFSQRALDKAKAARAKQRKGNGKTDGSASGAPNSAGKSAAAGATSKGLGGKLKGMKGAGGKGGIDPDALKSIADKARHGDKKGAVIEGARVGAGALLDKAMMACIDSLIPFFGLPLIPMNIIVFAALILKVKLPKWQLALTFGLDAIIVGIILFLFLIAFIILYVTCQAAGLDQGGVVATVAAPILAGVDWYNGNSLGTSFLEVCKVLPKL